MSVHAATAACCATALAYFTPYTVRGCRAQLDSAQPEHDSLAYQAAGLLETPGA